MARQLGGFPGQHVAIANSRVRQPRAVRPDQHREDHHRRRLTHGVRKGIHRRSAFAARYSLQRNENCKVGVFFF